jgi:hypothetical protein
LEAQTIYTPDAGEVIGLITGYIYITLKVKEEKEEKAKQEEDLGDGIGVEVELNQYETGSASVVYSGGYADGYNPNMMSASAGQGRQAVCEKKKEEEEEEEEEEQEEEEEESVSEEF